MRHLLLLAWSFALLSQPANAGDQHRSPLAKTALTAASCLAGCEQTFASCAAQPQVSQTSCPESPQ